MPIFYCATCPYFITLLVSIFYYTTCQPLVAPHVKAGTNPCNPFKNNIIIGQLSIQVHYTNHRINLKLNCTLDGNQAVLSYERNEQCHICTIFTLTGENPNILSLLLKRNVQHLLKTHQPTRERSFQHLCSQVPCCWLRQNQQNCTFVQGTKTSIDAPTETNKKKRNELTNCSKRSQVATAALSSRKYLSYCKIPQL